MEISTAWVNYVKRLSAIDKAATAKMGEFLNYWQSVAAEPFNFDNQKHMRTLINYAYGLSTKYGESAAALACEMYDAIGLASGLFLEPAVPVNPASYKDISIEITDAAGTKNMEIISSKVGRSVKRTGVNTMLNNASRDGAEVAWVPSGDTCAFCIALASRGWQKASYYEEHIHANCNCTLATRFNSKTSIKGYDPDEYADMYYDADLEGEAPTSKNRINALRRQFYAKNKEEINANKRMNYAERKERLNSSQAEETNVN